MTLECRLVDCLAYADSPNYCPHDLIYTGTIDSYYAGAKAGTITETTPLDPYIAWRNLYARAKAVSENSTRLVFLWQATANGVCR